MENAGTIRDKLRAAIQLIMEALLCLPPAAILRLVTDDEDERQPFWANFSPFQTKKDPRQEDPQQKNAPPRGILQMVSEMKTRSEAPFYSQEEIKRMPRLQQGRFRKTRDGLWQVRYRRDGYDIQFTSKSKQVVIDRFREWVKSVNDTQKAALPKKKQLFGEIAEQYFATVKLANVNEETCKSQHRSYELHIKPHFGDLPIRQITPMKCQALLKDLLDQGKGRTAETIKFILGEVFRSAVGEKIIAENPMQFVKIPKHIREQGKNIPLEIVQKFMENAKKTPYHKQLMVYLYTGIRRNELHSLLIEGDFISVICGKTRKGQPKRRRKIPISPLLRPFLPLSEEEIAVKNDVFTKNFPKICCDYTLNDLRHTFITHAQECGIPKALVDVWTDHVDKKDMTAGVYTHFSPTYQQAEIKKLNYDLFTTQFTTQKN